MKKEETVAGEYDKVGNPQGVGGRIAFVATKGGRQFVVNEKGERIGGGTTM